MIRRFLRSLLRWLGYDIRRLPVSPPQYQVEDSECYAPLFSPWLGHGDFLEYFSIASSHTLVSPDRCYVLLTLARQTVGIAGDWVECGVYKGGTAMMFAKVIQRNGLQKTLHLFDTFEGMPETAPDIDRHHKKGDFSDTDLDEVRARVRTLGSDVDKIVRFHPGMIPGTFDSCEIEKISFAHVDVDIYRSVRDCCEFIYPRLVPGGFLVFDDYGFPTCPGARKAVDEFFARKQEVPLVLPTGQAIVIRQKHQPSDPLSGEQIC